MSKFFIADPVHIHARNFGSLFDYLAESKAITITNNDHREMMSVFGNYTAYEDLLGEQYNTLKDLSDCDLFSQTLTQINLFKVARAEILSLTITSPELCDQHLPKEARPLFDLLLAEHRETVLWNMAAAMFWITIWSDRLKKHNPKFILVFSGSLIYARSLLELSRTHTARSFVLETFFTGNDNYIEEKFEPIANNSNLKHFAYYKSMEPKLTPCERDRERNKALNKVISAKNKNVSQPDETKVKLFKNQKATILITGQVLNDFSLLEHNNVGINSIAFYSQLIEKILAETELNVIFKAHPWERQKSNIKSALTLDTLCAKFNATPNVTSDDDRLVLIENFNIKSLFKQVNYIVGINSQALIESAFEGYRPIQFGNAFYGGKGFTSDYGLGDIDRFIDDIKSGSIPSHQGIEECRNYETFLLRTLQYSLISAFPSGKAQLKNIFNVHSQVPIMKGGAVPAAPSKTTITKPAPATPVAQKPPTGASATAAVTIPQAQIVSTVSTNLNSQSASSKAETSQSNNKSKKKWQKFWRTPKKFFFDSKNKRVRWLHVFFPAKLSFTGQN